MGTMPRRLAVLAASVLFSALLNPSLAGAPQADELALRRQWVTARFESDAKPSTPQSGLLVLANHDPVLRNTRGEGRPLTLGKATYKRGLYCHANSHVVVRLGGPGKTFSAIVGVDTNDQTSGGRGSIVFTVRTGDKKLFESPVMREGIPGAPVKLDLNGASELILLVGDSGDGISCDQADWADAKVTLADGREVWLGDLPFVEPDAQADAGPPFSFVYDGQPSALLLPQWKVERRSKPLDERRTSRTVTYSDPKTALVVRCEAVEYRDFPTVEWTVHFKNAGAADTPILSDIQAIDTRLRRPREGEFTLHHNTGSPCSASDYQPHATVLRPREAKRIATSGGRSTNSNMPYFNVDWGRGGAIVVLGWPGQWAAEFQRDQGAGLHVRGGQELTRLKLLPGEEIRTPLAVMQFWSGGDWIDAQNVWRRWMLEFNVPRPGGKPMPPGLMCCTSDSYPGMRSRADDEITYIDAYVRGGVKLDYWWIDAGWYPCLGGWPNVGTWLPDPLRYPKGLREVADHAHAKGMKLVVWFEPERVTRETWLAERRPEWVLGGHRGGLLNLGNPKAREWLTDHVDKLITSQGIDLYRQDFNMDPLGHWRGNDAPDRQGITEIRHCEGYLAYWDELLRRHPDMPIDSCASGGRRNDLETLRRSVPLLRSDYRFEPAGTQGHTYGMSMWIPYYGTGVGAENDYIVRSHWCPWLGIGMGGPLRKDADWGHYLRLVKDWKLGRELMLADYYPLTPYSLDQSHWMGWQFDRPETGEGFIQMFRRSESPYQAATFRLRGLEETARYTLTDIDTDQSRTLTGRELMTDGLRIEIPNRSQALVLLYKKQRS